MAMSIGAWVAVVLAGRLAVAQPASTPADLDRLLRELAAGRRATDRVRLETECLHEGRFVKAAAYGSGVATWQGERQGTLSAPQMRALLNAFVKERFARMPARFGEDEAEPARKAVKMTCRVRFSDGTAAKDVIQLDKGEQSAALKRLARAILDTAAAATRSAAPVPSLEEGLAAIGDGRLAVETLRITMRVGAGRGLRETNPRGWVLRLEGRDVEIDPDGAAPTRRRLEDDAVRALARALADARFARLPANVHAPDYVEVAAAVLGHEHAVQGRQLAAGDTQSPEIRARFTDTVARLTALREP